MRRTNLVLDERLLEEAVRVSGERTYSRTVERALRDLVARARARRILELAGSGLWQATCPSSARAARSTGRSAVVLVDTSVWIEAFRRPSRLSLDDVVDFDDIVTCVPVVQEVLQGFADERAYALARDAMHALPIVKKSCTGHD